MKLGQLFWAVFTQWAQGKFQEFENIQGTCLVLIIEALVLLFVPVTIDQPLFGKKLAPQVSPGKSIAGLVGGLLVTGAIAVIVGWRLELNAAQWILFLLVTEVTVLASVLGDLLSVPPREPARARC